MKLFYGFTLLLFALVFAPNVALSQHYNEDSLWKALKTSKDDTSKLRTLNTLASSLGKRGNSSIADSLAHISLALAKKLNSQSFISWSTRIIGSMAYQQRNDSAAIKNYFISLGIDSSLGNKKSIGMDYSYIGAAYLAMDKLDEATRYFSLALNYQKAENTTSRIYVTYQFLGILYRKQGKYPEALNNYQLSLKYAEEAKDYVIEGNDYLNMGNFQLEMKDDTDALRDYSLGLKAFEKANDRRSMGTAYGAMGNFYFDNKNYEAALDYYNQSLNIAEETGDKISITNAYGNIGNVYEKEHKYDEALLYQQKSLQIDLELQYQEGIIADYINLGGICVKTKKLQEAREYCQKAIDMSKKINSKLYLRESYRGMAMTDSLLGDFKSAYYAFNQYINYRDSLSDEDMTKKVVKEQMNFEFEKKQAIEKAEQDKKDGIAAADKRRETIIIASVSAGLLLVLIFSGLLLSRFRVTQKQKKIIEEQKVLVEEKNKEVLDSITYAKRLQDAILPPVAEIKKVLPESFILYKPKDIVAGDFYWMEIAGNNILIAAADCTGHGVPGAMVSVVCSNALNRAVKEFRILEPGKILDKVRDLVLETFEKSENDVKDGMDISLASIQFNNNAEPAIKDVAISWAGAYNPLWIVSSPAHEGEKDSILEIAPDKQPIGKQDNSKPFQTHKFNLKKGSILYLFTDGYADQFGGPEGKKFKYKQLQQKLLSLVNEPMQRHKEILDKTLEDWKGSLEQLDDILIIGIRV
jgi:tetratricopeptide (TPR) repeat protein